MEPTWPHPLVVALSDGEDWVSPRASKLAYRPVLKNIGWPSCRGAVGTIAKDKEKDVAKEDEEPGDGCCPPPKGGQGTRELRVAGTRNMPQKTSSSEAAALPAFGWGGGGLLCGPPPAVVACCAHVLFAAARIRC